MPPDGKMNVFHFDETPCHQRLPEGHCTTLPSANASLP